MADSTRSTSRQSSDSEAPTEVLEAVLKAFANASPFVRFNPAKAVVAVRDLGQAAISQPGAMARFTAGLSRELSKVAIGTSDIDLSLDRRFNHEHYLNNPILRRMGQQYLAWSRAVTRLIEELDLTDDMRHQARFTASMITEALAPTNTLVGNPAALEEAVRSRGKSLARGFNHWLVDQVSNGGMPSMVDTSSFVKGETIAATPGEVIARTDVFELIRYAPATDQVHSIPLVMLPPQINKYYVLDMAPSRSLVESAVAAGQQVFMVSWFNPGPDLRNWDLGTYVEAALEATDIAMDLTKTREVNLLGVCAGGITMAALLGHLAATGDARVNAATFLVAMLDWSRPSTVSSMIAGPNADAAITQSQANGILSGEELAKLFAWMRPNDLVWNYWTNNYLMGKNPPAFDILAWNVDSTNLPASLHADFVTMADSNSLVHANEMTVLDRKVDLSEVDCDAYVVGGITDHITDWRSCYETVNLLGGSTTFALAKSGHVQTLVSPLDNPRSRYYLGDDYPTSADSWLRAATEHTGTWVTHWLGWMQERSGERVDAPKRLHNKRHPKLGDAPGTYIHG